MRKVSYVEYGILRMFYCGGRTSLHNGDVRTRDGSLVRKFPYKMATLQGLISEGLVLPLTGQGRILTLTNNELRVLLHVKKLDIKGNKAVLIKRLLQNFDEDVDSQLNQMFVGIDAFIASNEGDKLAENWEEEFHKQQDKEREAIRSLMSDLGHALDLGDHQQAEALASDAVHRGLIQPPHESTDELRSTLKHIEAAKPQALEYLSDRHMTELRRAAQMQVLGVGSWRMERRGLSEDFPAEPITSEVAGLMLHDCFRRIGEFERLTREAPAETIVYQGDTESSCADCVRVSGTQPSAAFPLEDLPLSTCVHPTGCKLRLRIRSVRRKSDAPPRRAATRADGSLTPGERLREARRLLTDGLITKNDYDRIYESVLLELNNSQSDARGRP